MVMVNIFAFIVICDNVVYYKEKFLERKIHGDKEPVETVRKSNALPEFNKGTTKLTK